MAQESDSEVSSPVATQTLPRPSGPIRYVGPDTYILLDSEGRPQPVPGMTYEDFLTAWKKLNRPAAVESQPRFTIERIQIDGQTQGQRAELKFVASIHLLTDGPVDVPLGLVGTILQGKPRFEQRQPSKQPAAQDERPAKSKTRDEYLDFDPQHGGFVAHLNGSTGEQRLVSFDLIVPLVRDGAETTLSLNCPRSISSSLTLDVDTPVSEPRASTGAIIKSDASSDGGTRIEVAGPTGQFRLTWQAANKDAESVASVLNAVGAIQVTIDGRGVRSDARLTVRSFGGSFDQFRVRLPSGAKLIRAPAVAGIQEPKYRISEEPATRDATNLRQDSGRIVLVELKEKQQGPVVIDVSTEQPGHAANQAMELGGFEVLGAVRQFGDIGLYVSGDWQARWNVGRDVRQVDPTELDKSLQRSDLTSAFQYDRQAWSLGVQVSPRQSRVHVAPLYELEVSSEEARLHVRLAYQNFGARAFEFRVETNGWEISGEPVESGGLVDQDRVTVTPEGTLVLPLAQASTRKTEVAFSMRRPLDRNASKLRLPLPVPLADSVATGGLTVRVPAEIELLPDLASSTGLAAEPARGTAGQADSQAGAELHFRSLLPNAVFVASRSNRRREESAQIDVQIKTTADSLEVDERIEYIVDYQPITEFDLEAPLEIPFESEEVEIALVSAASGNSDTAEQLTPLRFETSVDDDEDLSMESRRVRVTLPQPRIGKFTIVARYRVLRSPASPGTIDVPMLSPIDAHITSQRATVLTPKGLYVSLGSVPDASSWRMTIPQRKKNVAGSEFEFFADRSEIVLPLNVGTADAGAPSSTVVDRVWLQTWISGGVKQDRAAFRIRSSSGQTTVELPPEAPPGEVEVLVDGQPAEVSSRAAGRILVRLSRESSSTGDATAEPATHTLEVRFRRAVQPAIIARHSVTPPRIDGTTDLSQIYWQIILPGDEHIVQSPEQLVSASQWQWLGSFWGRRPIKSQTELEEWVSAAPQQAPTAASNEYLYTGMLPVSSISYVTAPRWLVVLLASSAALALLTGWLYGPITTRPWTLIVMIVVIAAAAVAYPTAALLIAQASAIGIVFAGLSAFISRIVARPAGRVVAQPASPSTQRTLTPRADSMVMPGVMATASTSPTITLRAPDSER